MKLVNHFNDFLNDTVNLNATRVELLDNSIPAVKDAVRDIEYKPKILGFEAQGSWAHKTIIKPVGDKPFDADLIVFVAPVEGWEAKDYVNKLFAGLNAHPTYKDKVTAYSHCVTIEYANERRIDITPCVRNRLFTDIDEVCNRNTNAFEQSRPTAYTAWLIGRNDVSGSNSFRKVTRLMKYLRVIKTTFTCPSFLLTTLLGNQIYDWDKGGDAFVDTPTALKTLIGRLDEWLQANPNLPQVYNPVLSTELQSTAWDQDKYSNFRDRIHTYRGWVDDAYDEADRAESIGKWRRLFGDDFAAGEVAEKAERISEAALASAGALVPLGSGATDLVDLVKRAGAPALPAEFTRLPHMRRPRWRQVSGAQLTPRIQATLLSSNRVDFRTVQSFEPLQRGYRVRFQALQQNGLPIGDEYEVKWRVTNTDKMAAAARQLRGDFYPSEEDNARVESLSYRGVHMVEAFLVRRRDKRLAGFSRPHMVVIE